MSSIRGRGKSILALAAVSVAVIPAVHLMRLHAIELKCSAYRRQAINGISPELAVREALAELNRRNYKNCTDPGGYDFILGDFKEEQGKVRCGGAARIFAETLARRGFQTQIRMAWVGMSLHYFTVATKEGQTWTLKGTPPKAYAECSELASIPYRGATTGLAGLTAATRSSPIVDCRISSNDSARYYRPGAPPGKTPGEIDLNARSANCTVCQRSITCLAVDQCSDQVGEEQGQIKLAGHPARCDDTCNEWPTDGEFPSLTR